MRTQLEKRNPTIFRVLWDIYAILNFVWRTVADYGTYVKHYPNDWFIHDRRVIESMEEGQWIVVRFYDLGTHVIDHSWEIPENQISGYFRDDPDAFGSNRKAVYIRIYKQAPLYDGEDAKKRLYNFQDVTAQYRAIYSDHILDYVDRSDFDPKNAWADPYGAAMALWSDIATYLYALGEDIPEHWEYKPPHMMDPDDLTYTDPFDINRKRVKWDDQMSIDRKALDRAYDRNGNAEIIHLGNILCRYTEALKRKGMDY